MAGQDDSTRDGLDAHRIVYVIPMMWLPTLLRQPGPRDSFSHFQVTSQDILGYCPRLSGWTELNYAFIGPKYLKDNGSPILPMQIKIVKILHTENRKSSEDLSFSIMIMRVLL